MKMKYKLKSHIKKRKKIYFAIELLLFLKNINLIKTNGSHKKYPLVLQFPITYRCNSRCVMCNIYSMDKSNEMSYEELKLFLKDPIFKEVNSVGINGGEPSLVPELPRYVDEILNLRNIKFLNIISNGYSKSLLEHTRIIYKRCQEKGVHFHISVSLDGVGTIHDNVRGISKAFEKTTASIDEIMKNRHLYCDTIDVGCTLVKQNIDYIVELDTYATRKSYDIKYRLGIENKRIGSNLLRNRYSILDYPHKQTAKEFIHCQIGRAKNWSDKYKYFSIFYFLDSNNPKRLLGCTWREEGITMDSRGDLYYCAVASNKIGSLRRESGEQSFFNDSNINHRKDIINNYCDRCIHDYSGKPELGNVLLFFRYLTFEIFWVKLYKIKSMLI